MIPSIVISPDDDLADQLEAAVTEAGRAALVRKIKSYPSDHALVRLIRAHAPQMVFIDIAEIPEALRVAAEVESLAPGVQIVAVDRSYEQNKLLELMRAGVREFLAMPFGAEEVNSALDRISAALQRKPPSIEVTDTVLAFLPSKPGVGCSTVALNTAVALAATKTRTLLMDFDLTCGMIGFLLHLDPSPSVIEATEHAPHMDDELWPKLVRQFGSDNLDVLPAGHMKPGHRVETTQIRYLLEFARRNYQAVCVDLSGLMERFSVEVMQEATGIYLVCTPELPSLFLAREKLEFLRTIDVEGRVRLLVNRAQKRQALSNPDIEKMLGLQIALDLPNDYRGVHKALTEAKPVAPNSELGRRFTELARRVLSKDAAPSKERRFVDYFTITPARFTLGPAAKSE
jgi:Flp pilus assembly CpaE family ATPase